MPIYEYKCNLCGHNEEVLEQSTVSNCRDCHNCGAMSSMEKQYSVPSIHNAKSVTKNTKKESLPCQGSGCNCPFANK